MPVIGDLLAGDDVVGIGDFEKRQFNPGLPEKEPASDPSGTVMQPIPTGDVGIGDFERMQFGAGEGEPPAFKTLPIGAPDVVAMSESGDVGIGDFEQLQFQPGPPLLQGAPTSVGDALAGTGQTDTIAPTGGEQFYGGGSAASVASPGSMGRLGTSSVLAPVKGLRSTERQTIDSLYSPQMNANRKGFISSLF
jgi:hypothetical protein